MERSDDMKKYLANKHKGGENNQKGGAYEDYYAVFQIVSCLAKYKYELDAVSFETQLKDTFVDDLLIAHPNVNVYHQLKNTQSVTWGTIQTKGDIAFDFAHQIEDCKKRNEDFALKLIYSAKDSNIGANIPDEIGMHSQAEWFPYKEDINQLVMISGELKDALKAISAEGYEATDDILVNIAMVFLGVWKAFGNKKRMSLSDIVAKVEQLKYVNLIIYPNECISKECKGILDGIEGIEYHISGRMFYWKFGFFQGSYPWPDELEEKIISANPKTKLELLALLS